MRTFSKYAILSTLLVLACKPRVSDKVSTVDIPQSPVDNQYRVGFCWAYTITAFVESMHKRETGRDLNLSEEALGFYRVAEELHSMVSEAESLEAFLTKLEATSLQGWTIREADSARRIDGFQLMKKHGVWPESAYPVKFRDTAQKERTFETIKQRMRELAGSKPLASITLDEIASRVIVGPESLFTSAPPRAFLEGGSRYVSTAYLREKFRIDPETFTVLQARGPGDYERLVGTLRSVLGMGIPVPLSFGVNPALLTRTEGISLFSGHTSLVNAFTARTQAQAAPPEKTFQLSRHAVLITDFVNEGGREGALPPAELARELARPATDLSYIKIKNSWGIQAEADEAGRTILGSIDGYYRIDRPYLEGSLREGTILQVVVPRDAIVE